MPLKDKLLAGEEVIFTSEKHWFAPLRDSLIPFLLLIGAWLVGVISPTPGEGFFGFLGNLLSWFQLGLAVVGIAWIVYNIVVWRTATFAVTNHRVMREEGFISRRSSATMLQTVTDVQSDVPMLGRPLGFGDLVILTQSGEAGVDRFQTITHPVEFRDKIMGTKLSGAPQPVAAAPAPPPAPVAAALVAAARAAPSDADQLATLTRLAELRDSGAITPEEYEAKKAELLSRI